MPEATVFLRALHVADGTLPIGRFSHSYGVEAWLEAYPDAGPEDLRELVESTLAGSFATLDGAAVALSHARRGARRPGRAAPGSTPS